MQILVAFYSTGDYTGSGNGKVLTLMVFVKVFIEVPRIGSLRVSQRTAGGAGQ